MALVGVIVHDITDPYFAEIVRGVEDAASPAGYLVITCSSERDARAKSRITSGCCANCAPPAVIFAGSGLDDAALNAELPRHVAAMRESGAAVVHLSPSAEGEPEIRVDNAGGIAAMVAALVGLGHRRIAFLAAPQSLYVHAPASGRLSTGPGRCRHRVRRAAGRADRLLRRGRARAAWTRCSPGRGAVHGDLLRERPDCAWAPWRDSTSSASPFLAMCPSPASTTYQWRQ